MLKATNFPKLFKSYKGLFKTQNFKFSYDLKLPIIDLDKFINRREGWESECKILAECLHDTGVLCVKDSVK